MQEDPPRDAGERNVRIGCGTLLGLLFAGLIGFQIFPSWTAWAIITIVCVVVCAWLAVRFGDSFCEELSNLFDSRRF